METEEEQKKKTKESFFSFLFSTPNHERFQRAPPSLSPPPNWPNLPPCLRRRRTRAAIFFRSRSWRFFEPVDPRTPSLASGKRVPRSRGEDGRRRECAALAAPGAGQETSRSLLGCKKTAGGASDLAATSSEATASGS